MYPNLTPTLAVLLGIALAVTVLVALRRPFLRRLALRQVSRRRTEAALVICGSLLGTAIIVGSLIVGDTLNFSVKQSAYTNLGPIDEIVGSATQGLGQRVAVGLRPLRSDPPDRRAHVRPGRSGGGDEGHRAVAGSGAARDGLGDGLRRGCLVRWFRLGTLRPDSGSP